jgi:hypothetical protein
MSLRSRPERPTGRHCSAATHRGGSRRALAYAARACPRAKGKRTVIGGHLLYVRHAYLDRHVSDLTGPPATGQSISRKSNVRNSAVERFPPNGRSAKLRRHQAATRRFPSESSSAMVIARGSTLMDLPGVGPGLPPGSSQTSETWPGSPTATGSRAGSALHRWTPSPESRSGTGCPGGEPEDEPHAAHRRSHPGHLATPGRAYFRRKVAEGLGGLVFARSSSAAANSRACPVRRATRGADQRSECSSLAARGARDPSCTSS